MELGIFLFFVILASVDFIKGISYGIFTIIVFCIMYILVRKFCYTRINGFLIVDKRDKVLTQSISLKISLKNLFRNVFDNKRSLPKYSYAKELMMSNKKKDRLEIYFKNNSGKILKTYTNDNMLNQLKKYEKKGIIEIETVQAVKKENQELARICYVGIGTIIYNCRNKIFKDYINEEINVGRYRIIIK